MEEKRTLDEIIENIPIMKELELNSRNCGKSRYPRSAYSLTTYSIKLQYLNNSINYCKDIGDYYSLCVLFRSLLEHYFRHLYIYTRALKENSDDVGIEYYGKLNGHEDLCSLRSNISLNTKLTGIKSILSLGGEQNKSLDDIAQNFKINNILSYINENIGENSELRETSKDSLNRYSRLYSTLSSFVHGGPYAEKYMGLYSKNNTSKDKDIEFLSDETNSLTNQARENTSLFIEITTEKT
ncbi:MAG TPA: hypothetical protein VJ579_01595 [Candidatus Paceibacterota bacterium]|nr:hypothetical protein [Candidatus Paceibacterota bacterium]